MINVCLDCLRPNPLSEKKCGYCQSDCQAIKTQEFGIFMITRQKQNKEKEKKKRTILNLFLRNILI